MTHPASSEYATVANGSLCDPVGHVANVGQAGIIYSALNLTTGKRYVGKSINFKKRWNDHRRSLIAGRHINRHFQAAYTKNPNYWLWVILDTATYEEELDEKECLWIEYFQSNDDRFGYNLTAGGDGGSKAPETRAKISAAGRKRVVSPETRAKISAARMGMKFSAEFKARLSLRFLGNQYCLGRTYSDEQRASIARGVKAYWEKRRLERESQQIT